MKSNETRDATLPDMVQDDDLTSSLGEIGMNNFAPYLMNRIMARYNASVLETLKGLDLTTPKMRVLSVLSVVKGPVIRELSIFSLIEQSTLSRVLDSMESDDLIRREPNENDSRSFRIHLTPQGEAYFEKIWPKMSREYQRMFAGTSREDRITFVATLQKILTNIRKNEL